MTTAALAGDQTQDVGFGDLHFRVDRPEIGNGHQRRAGLILDADHHHLAFADAQTADDAVDRRRDRGLGQHVVGPQPLRAGLSDAARRRVGGLPCASIAARTDVDLRERAPLPPRGQLSNSAAGSMPC